MKENEKRCCIGVPTKTLNQQAKDKEIREKGTKNMKKIGNQMIDKIDG